jgi:glycosyltransferase involved in cell wall biosynthesis
MDNALQQGEVFFNAGDLENAEHAFLSVPTHDPGYKIALNNLGVVAYRQNDVERARAFFQKSLDADPSYSEARDNLNALPPLPAQVAKKKLLLIMGSHGSLNQLHFDFLSPLFDLRYPKSMDEAELSAMVEWCDYIYSLELNIPFIWITQNRPGKPMALRMGGDEIVGHWMGLTRWEHVKGIIFAAPHLAEAADAFWKPKTGHCLQAVIRDGFDITRFPFYENGPGHNIAYIQNFTRHAGTDLFLQCMARGSAVNPSVKFHIAGELENVRFVTYFIHLVKAMGLGGAVQSHGPQADLVAFLKPINSCLSTHLWEGSPVPLLSAMACGIRPLIHRWKGATDLFPREWTFASLSEFEKMMTSKEYTPRDYREHVAKNFDARMQLTQVESFLRSL